MKKSEIRKIYREKRQALSHAEKDKLEDLMLIQFQTLPIAIPATIMSFLPMEKFNEFNPIHIEEFCAFKSNEQILSLPVVTANGLEAIVINDETVYNISSFGVAEPAGGATIKPDDIGLVIVPLLAFDERGYRVGYGKGYYDKFLAQCAPDTIKVGFSFFDPLNKIEDVHAHDVRLDYCVTPNSVYEFC